MPRKGFGAAVTLIPVAWRSAMTPSQLDESAKAPWTRTTVSGALRAGSDMRAPYWAWTSMTAWANASGAS
jgi:hypothetical protein